MIIKYIIHPYEFYNFTEDKLAYIGQPSLMNDGTKGVEKRVRHSFSCASKGHMLKGFQGVPVSVHSVFSKSLEIIIVGTEISLEPSHVMQATKITGWCFSVRRSDVNLFHCVARYCHSSVW